MLRAYLSRSTQRQVHERRVDGRGRLVSSRLLLAAVTAAVTAAAVTAAVVTALVLVAGTARAGPLTITRWTIDAGGSGFSRVGTWTLAGTTGQPDAGRLVGSPYTLQGGFWGPGPLVVSGVQLPDPTDPADPVAEAAPAVARIVAPAPNPTPGAARFGFELPEARPVRIQIFNVTGALVRTVTNRVWNVGRHQVAWDGRDAHGGAAAAGLYFVRVRLGSLERTQKLLVVR